MAVTKLWSVKVRLAQVLDYATNPEKTTKSKSKYSMADYQALRDVLAYAKDEEKTEREFFCQGINCNVNTAREQFVTVKEQFGKTGGIQAYHGYISFKEQDITPELAQRVGMEFAERVWGKRYQVVVTTHLNTKHLHCHFVVNSVSIVDGKMLHGEEKAWFKFRHIADEICQKYGLYYDPNPNRSYQSSYLNSKEKAGVPTRYSMLRAAIDEAISCSTSLAEFDYALKSMGYSHQLSPSRKYWTVIPKGYDRPVRLKNLGEDYTNEAIIARLKENQGKVILKPFQKSTVKVRQYKLPTREHKIRKVGGLYGLYLYYCYALGYLPKYKQQNSHRLHYLLRDDLMKLDELTAQTQLLGREKISNAEELFSYRSTVEDEMKKLDADRKRLRNKERTKIDDAELSAVKDQISVLTDRLGVLRKEVKLCDGIAERSGILREKLQTALAEEEKQKGKENRRHELRR